MATWVNIIVVEDHDLMREQLLDFLQRPGWDVRGVESGDQLDTELRTRPADVVVLDLNLPGEDGISIAARLRAALPQIGIVMLSGRTRPGDRADGYATGADVYLTKPTNVRELESVIENLVKRLHATPLSAYLLDVRKLRLFAPGGATVELTLMETELLEQLAIAPERQLTTDFLLYKLSQEYALTKNRDALTVLISRLRHKCAQVLGDADLIKAIRGYGYKLTVPLTIA